MKQKILTILLGLFSFTSIIAQEDVVIEEVVETTESMFTFPVVVSILLLVSLLIALFTLSKILIRDRAIKLYEEYGIDTFLDMRRSSWLEGVNRVLTNAVPVDNEQEIQLDHDYDGIKELDNDLPPWWLWMFYLTIAAGVVYFSYFHVFNLGLNQQEQYVAEMETAKAEIEAYLATQANLVDESNVTALADAISLEEGRAIFELNCAACHLNSGGGSVGPNLTDEYWIHGGGIKNVFKTVKYGVPEKGMISWQTQMSASDMHKVSSYILTLAGTNPVDGKEPQGEFYIDEDADPKVVEEILDELEEVRDTLVQ